MLFYSEETEARRRKGGRAKLCNKLAIVSNRGEDDNLMFGDFESSPRAGETPAIRSYRTDQHIPSISQNGGCSSFFGVGRLSSETSRNFWPI